MSFKCLNCKTVCSPNDPHCPFCGSRVSDTSSELKKGSASKKGAGVAVIFIIVGTAIFNTVIGPKYYPNGGDDKLFAAAGFGAICAVVGLLFGWLTTDRD